MKKLILFLLFVIPTIVIAQNQQLPCNGYPTLSDANASSYITNVVLANASPRNPNPLVGNGFVFEVPPTLMGNDPFRNIYKIDVWIVPKGERLQILKRNAETGEILSKKDSIVFTPMKVTASLAMPQGPEVMQQLFIYNKGGRNGETPKYCEPIRISLQFDSSTNSFVANF